MLRGSFIATRWRGQVLSQDPLHDDVAKWCENCGFMNGYPRLDLTTIPSLMNGIGDDIVTVAVKGEGTTFNQAFTFAEYVESGKMNSDNYYVKYTQVSEDASYKLEVIPCK